MVTERDMPTEREDQTDFLRIQLPTTRHSSFDPDREMLESLGLARLTAMPCRFSAELRS